MGAKEITVSSEAEEYLEAIYRLEKKTGFAETMELARELKVVPGSVTNTVRAHGTEFMKQLVGSNMPYQQKSQVLLTKLWGTQKVVLTGIRYRQNWEK